MRATTYMMHLRFENCFRKPKLQKKRQTGYLRFSIRFLLEIDKIRENWPKHSSVSFPKKISVKGSDLADKREQNPENNSEWPALKVNFKVLKKPRFARLTKVYCLRQKFVFIDCIWFNRKKVYVDVKSAKTWKRKTSEFWLTSRRWESEVPPKIWNIDKFFISLLFYRFMLD